VSFANCSERAAQLVEVTVALRVFVVLFADAVEADREPLQARRHELVDTVPEQSCIRRDVGIEADAARVTDHRGQVFVQQRLAAVEARCGDSCSPRVVERLQHRLQRQSFADHEVASVAAAAALQVARCGDRDRDLARLRLDQCREAAGEVVLPSEELLFRGPCDPFDRRVLAQPRP